jgi:hypothetical protein
LESRSALNLTAAAAAKVQAVVYDQQIAALTRKVGLRPLAMTRLHPNPR